MLTAVVLAQSIAVVASPALRPTPVLLANVQYTVAADSAFGGVVIRNLTVPPVLFAGAVHVEGAEPLAREPEPRFYADSVRFESDGRVTLVMADGRRAPLDVSVEGGAAAPGGRLVITSPGWPRNRVMLITIRPADIVEYVWRATGWLQRDRIRIDDAEGMAYLTDPSTGMSVAIGFGPGQTGRIQEDATDITVRRRIGQDVAVEPLRVGALMFFAEPSRSGVAVADARVEIVFGIGRTEQQAAVAARAAASATAGPPAAPILRANTPEPAVRGLLQHLLSAAGPTLAAGWIPGSLDAPWSQNVAGAEAATLAVQAGRPDAVCGEYVRFRDAAAGGSQRAAIGVRLGAQGPVRWVQDTTGADDSSLESAQILKAFACYRATRDSTFLVTELPGLIALGRAAGEKTTDRLRPAAFDALAELLDERARRGGPVSPGDSLRTLAARHRGPAAAPRGAALWRSIAEEARDMLSGRYGRVGAAEAGRFIDRVAGQLFGVEEKLDRVVIAPAMDGAFDDFRWRLDGWRVFEDTLSVLVRPAAREATITLHALTARRVELRIPWLTATSCVTVRRGRETRQAQLVFTNVGSAYLDLRAFYEPAEVFITARGCL